MIEDSEKIMVSYTHDGYTEYAEGRTLDELISGIETLDSASLAAEFFKRESYNLTEEQALKIAKIISDNEDFEELCVFYKARPELAEKIEPLMLDCYYRARKNAHISSKGLYNFYIESSKRGQAIKPVTAIDFLIEHYDVDCSRILYELVRLDLSQRERVEKYIIEHGNVVFLIKLYQEHGGINEDILYKMLAEYGGNDEIHSAIKFVESEDFIERLVKLFISKRPTMISAKIIAEELSQKIGRLLVEHHMGIFIGEDGITYCRNELKGRVINALRDAIRKLEDYVIQNGDNNITDVIYFMEDVSRSNKPKLYDAVVRLTKNRKDRRYFRSRARNCMSFKEKLAWHFNLWTDY